MNVETIQAYQCECTAAYATLADAENCGTCNECGSTMKTFSGRHQIGPCDICRAKQSRAESTQLHAARTAKELALPLVEATGEQWCVNDNFIDDLDDYVYDAQTDIGDWPNVIVYNTRKERLGTPSFLTSDRIAEAIDEEWGMEFNDWAPDPVGGDEFDNALKALTEAIDEQGPTIYYPITTERVDMAAYAVDFYRRNSDHSPEAD